MGHLPTGTALRATRGARPSQHRAGLYVHQPGQDHFWMSERDRAQTRKCPDQFRSSQDLLQARLLAQGSVMQASAGPLVDAHGLGILQDLTGIIVSAEG